MNPFRPPRHPLVPPGGIDCHVTDMTATFSADVTLGAAQTELAKHGQWLPIDGDAHATIGHLVDINSTGPLRLGYGAWRDLLLGAQFHNGKGELITAGGRTMKNVAGYDLTKFMVGQRGMFGKLIALTTRTYRRPTDAVLARFKPDVRRLNGLLTTSGRPQWALLAPAGLLCGYVGDAATMAFTRDALAAHQPIEIVTRNIEADIAHRAQLWRAPAGEPYFRASLPPTRIDDFIRTSGRGAWIADAAFGIVLGAYDVSGGWEVLRSAAQVGGSAILLNPDGSIAEYSMPAGEQALLKRLKISFDPQGRLSPLPIKQQQPR